jgi:hypothetical protein
MCPCPAGSCTSDVPPIEKALDPHRGERASSSPRGPPLSSPRLPLEPDRSPDSRPGRTTRTRLSGGHPGSRTSKTRVSSPAQASAMASEKSAAESARPLTRISTHPTCPPAAATSVSGQAMTAHGIASRHHPAYSGGAAIGQRISRFAQRHQRLLPRVQSPLQIPREQIDQVDTRPSTAISSAGRGFQASSGWATMGPARRRGGHER